MKIHLIGMGGIGMSGLAKLLLEKGHQVSGSDHKPGKYLTQLQAQGANISVGHEAAQLENPDLVVYSSSIPPENPELLLATQSKIPILHRGELLAQLVNPLKTIAVTGAHGKSTTTGLLGSLALEAGLDPTIALGAEVNDFGGNARHGQGDWAVVEADESDASLLYLEPHLSVITNMDEEHLDYFRNADEIEQMYRQFVDQTRGPIVACWDDAWTRKTCEASARFIHAYGFSEDATYSAQSIESGAGFSRYVATKQGDVLGSIELKIPGRHNVLNSLAVVAVADALELGFDAAQRACARYTGAKKRFQVRAEANDICVIEDYAHHPVEIAATLEAAKTWTGKRLVCVFQPHRYTRTQHLMDRFVHCFDLADEVILLPIFSAAEHEVEGVNTEALRDLVASSETLQASSVTIQTQAEVNAYLHESLKPGDAVLFLGAGDIANTADQFVEQFAQAVQS